ncbi:MAG TPA: HNH endonuclease [Caldilineaceae bacterium]|mgnify:CR=1 FL=1|nr:HNH endonuclease [Caldilineaceae bacterium]
MSKSYISPTLRQKVVQAAKERCGYCQTSASLIGMPLEIEHIIPEAQGGTSQEDNLWLACPKCNQKKGIKVSAIDSQTGEEATIFNPRQQVWKEHFIWDGNGLYIIGLTPTGRVTVDALDMNNSHIVNTRQIWIQWGVHPPSDEEPT